VCLRFGKRKDLVVRYDPAVIQKFADKLYAMANAVVAAWTIVGAIVGAGVGMMAMNAFREFDQRLCFVGGVALVGLIGYIIGQGRSFSLKLQAQLALCQLQIEVNTRYLTVGPHV
jgi:uncharacterized protein (DUF697 family)